MVTCKIRKQQRIWVFLIVVWVSMAAFPIFSMGQEVKGDGWSLPDLKGLIPYSISVKRIDGVEKTVEKFYTPNGGHVARISGNGKVFAYAVDSDREPPMDYLLVDTDGSGNFTHKFKAEESYSIPEWIRD